MRRIRINQGKVGVVTHKGDYKKVLTAGKHWIGLSDKVALYDMSKLYTSTADLNTMLQDENFKLLVEVVSVNNNEIAIKYVENLIDSVLESGRYFYFKGFSNFEFVKIDLSKVEITEAIDRSLFQKYEIGKYIRVFNVAAYEEGLLFVNGKFVRKLEKGIHHFWKNEISIEVLKADLRQQQQEISGQEILTKDKATLRINFYNQYKVSDSIKALTQNKDFEKQLYILSQLALREFVGTLTLDELLENKNAVSNYVKEYLKNRTEILGIELIDSGIRDVILPGDVKEIMNQVLIAQKKAQANIITRREETASTRSLLNTAKLMEDNAMLFKLKEMEYVERIADKVGEITVSGSGKVLDQLTEIFSKS